MASATGSAETRVVMPIRTERMVVDFILMDEGKDG